MAYAFDARVVALDRDEDVLIVGFADDPTDYTRYLTIQYLQHYSEGDREDGSAEPYLEIEDQSRSCYGGVVEIRLSRHRILLKTDQEANRHLQIDGGIEISFGEATFDFGSLAAALETISQIFSIPLVHEYPRSQSSMLDSE